MTIDPRLAERRKVVAEDRAQRNVGRLLKFLVLIIALAALAWLAVSPWLSVSQVRTSGIVTSDAHAILARHRVVAGTPMVFLRPATVEAELAADPWISDARVHRNWPDEVIVRVVERIPAAWVETADGWAPRSIDGAALPGSEDPDDSLPWVHLPFVSGEEAASDASVLGAVEFFDHLPVHLWENSRIYVESGELWAAVDGHDVRLGRPVEMAQKAATLTAILQEDLRDGVVIVLIAPTHPALSPTKTGPIPEGPLDRSGTQP